MTKFEKIAFWVIAVIVVGLLLSQWLGSGNTAGINLQGIYSQVQQNFDAGGLRVGAGAHAITYLDNTSCNLKPSLPGTIAASSTVQYYCAIAGVKTGDYVRVILPRPSDSGQNVYFTGGMGNGLQVVTAYATSTGFIGVDIANNTGAATTTTINATSTKVLIVR